MPTTRGRRETVVASNGFRELAQTMLAVGAVFALLRQSTERTKNLGCWLPAAYFITNGGLIEHSPARGILRRWNIRAEQAPQQHRSPCESHTHPRTSPQLRAAPRPPRNTHSSLATAGRPFLTACAIRCAVKEIFLDLEWIP